MANVDIGNLIWKITGDASQIKKVFKSTETGASKLGKILKTAFTGAAIALLAKSAVELGKKLFSLALVAGDLAESQNAVNVVFGEASDIITEFGENSVREVGLATTSFNELATTIGAQLKQSGLDIDAVADSTIALTKRAADTASIFNVEVNESLNAFGAALRGEAEPARRFGVNISDAAVQAEALASGLVDTKNEITDQIKVQARYALILKQTSDYTGDFANTQDSFTNQVKIAKENIQQLGASIGEDLLPAATKGVTEFNKLIETLIETRKEIKLVTEASEAVAEGTATAEQKIIEYRRQLDALNDSYERSVELGYGNAAVYEQQKRSIETLIAIAERQAGAEARGARQAELDAIAAEEKAAKDEADATAADERAAAAAAQALIDAKLAEDIATRKAVARVESLQLQEDAEASMAANIYEIRQRAIEQEDEARRLEDERHKERIANIQSELAMYSQVAGNIGDIFSNLISLQMSGDEELTAKKKKNIIALYRMQQAANIAQIAIDTARAIVGFLANPSGPLGIVLAAGAGIMGATQAAIVAATPPPALQDGGVIPATPGGRLVRVAEQGRAEAIVPLDQGGVGGQYTFIITLDGAVIAKNTVDKVNAGQYTIDASRGIS